ncbi:hypothetical protein CVO96_01605 [Deinococcus koreensis]|uniref:Uncharacterized protein n=1 Tax=Deinococcus koreensis TaxID=2054903 RepID=A0A2K3UUL1_9DEIO|nr:hypothetical protein CVO96_01605 [Deinococcus koreensis]
MFTGIVLLIVATTAASLATGTRQSGADERQAYQALLVAESGLNSLPRRAAEYVRDHPYPGTPVVTVQVWLDGLRSYIEPSLAAGSTLTLTALASPADSFTATYRSANGTATKVIAQDYTLTPRTLPPGVRPRSAVTSLPGINVGNTAPSTGNGNGNGKAGGGSSGSASVSAVSANGGVITQVASGSPAMPLVGGTVNVTVASASGLRAGDYITIKGATFKVSTIVATTLGLTRVTGTTSATATTLSGDVGLLMSAVAAAYPIISSPTTIRLSNPSDYLVGEIVSIKGVYATITSMDRASGLATIVWSSTPPTTLDEGTPIYRDVTALRSGGVITPPTTLSAYTGSLNGTSTPDCTTLLCRGTSDPLLSPTGTSGSFTQMMLGMSDTELNDLVPLTTTTFPALNNGIMRINGTDFDAALKNKTASGVLIVDGNITSSVNGNTTFNGFIYVRGCTAKFVNGSFTLNGAMAIRGDTTCSPASTDITGNLSVNYSAVSLRQAMLNAAGSYKLDVIAGTWRQN